ncbi:MAG: DUF6094 domain-containing protein [Anaerolineae bacterium]|nr:DUF6094 domain-containing protein [Anaerolineae bacterium]
MSRLASAARAHFYPIQPAVVAQIAAHIAAPHGGRVWDPCAGEGAALAQLATLLGLEPFGNELHQGRAAAAATAVDTVVNSNRPLAHRDRQVTRVFAAAVNDMHVAHNAFTLLYLNPPFDTDAEEKRLELAFLKATRQALAVGGLLVWIIPQRVLRVEKAATYLAGWFDDVRVLRFPDDSRQYKQVVVFGVHRGNGRSRQPDAETVAWLRQCGRLGDELTALTATERELSPVEAMLSPAEAVPSTAELALSAVERVTSTFERELSAAELVLSPVEAAFHYTLPAVVIPSARLRFEPQRVDRQLLQREMAAHGVLTLPAWREQTHPAQDGQKAFRPLTPMRQGHILNLIAAGYLDNMSLAREQTVLMLKGQAYKQTIQQESAETDEEGNTTLTTTYTEQFQVRIKTLEPDGEINTLEGEQLHSFMADWLTPITDRLVAQYAPVYSFDLNGYQAVLDTLNQGRTIPNTDMRGLAPAQQHAVAAAATRLDKRYQDAQDAIIVGEMGIGKTLCGPATAICIQAARTLVLCPPHLVKKWQREIRHVVPWARVLVLKTIADVDTFFTQPASAAEPVFGVLKETTARSASGWEHAYDWCGPVRQQPAKQGSPAQATAASALVNAFWEHAAAFRKLPDEAQQTFTVPIRRGDQTRHVRYIALWRYLTTRRRICDPTTGAAVTMGDRPITPADFRRKQLTQQGNPLYSATRRRSAKQEAERITLTDALQRQNQMQVPIRAGLEPYGNGPRISTDAHGLEPVPLCPFASGSAKWPLATYIKQRYAGRLDLLIADEAHEYKGHDSDRGYAFARLVRAARKVLLLTGTVYGGKASTLFSLLYRSTTDLRQTYDHRAVAAWVRQYGVLQEVVKTRLDANGKQTGNKRNRSTVRELPGASPALVRWLLDRSVFVGLEDLGFALPDYDERPQLVAMTPAMAERYSSLLGQLKAAIAEALLRGDHSLLGGYLSALITWPDAPWRGKTVVHPRTGEVVASVPPLDMLPGEAPKEADVVARIQRELLRGRRVLLLCQQTETLDITPQWVDLLDRHGIRSAVLRCDPAQREAWIARQEAAGTEVIITHPRRVQTGLDILGYPAVMWLGTEYSVYTIRQTNRRPYRIGQTADVTVDFWAYADTLQEHALRLIAAKMAASYQIDGELVTDNAMTDLGYAGDDLVQMLARIVVGGDQPAATASLSDAFAQANRATASYRRFIGHEQPELAAGNGSGHGGADSTLTSDSVIRPKTSIETAPAPLLQQDTRFRLKTEPTNGNAAAQNGGQDGLSHSGVRPKTRFSNGAQAAAVDALIRPKDGNGIGNGVAAHANGHESNDADIRPNLCRAAPKHLCRATSKQTESSKPQPPPTTLFDLFRQYEQGAIAAHDG